MSCEEIGEKKEKVMRTEILNEKMEKVEKEMKKEVEVKEQVEVEVVVVVVVGVRVKVKLVPLKRMRKEVQRIRQVVDVIKAWKAFPPRESNKAVAMKMADEALKLLTMFGSPTPSQPNSTPAEGASSSKRKPTASAPSPSQQKGK
ncbi:hypothetical protein Scep_029050 [Stephania cephalantha]|uniref:Uncharacterized protein n=1 Tax=Stephania cephalantha TaxID=152367 RepID=A0AAP0DWV2_9MAGN